MTVEEWKVQASVKFGPNQSGLLNIRAASPDELATMCDYITERTQAEDFLSGLADALNAAPPTTGQAQTNIVNAFPQAQQMPAPTCQHGPMKDLSHKNYRKRWYCPAPKGQPQCDARD